jgi:hypothetical protein
MSQQQKRGTRGVTLVRENLKLEQREEATLPPRIALCSGATAYSAGKLINTQHTAAWNALHNYTWSLIRYLSTISCLNHSSYKSLKVWLVLI